MRREPLPLVLASASPRRAALLAAAGIRFERGPAPEIDETPPPGEPGDVVRVLAEAKAREVAARMPGRAVLAADTLVFLDGVPVGKPRDMNEAVRILRRLSGRAHEVATGVALAKGEGLWSGAALSTVRFRALGDEEIRRYVDGGEPLDKAGGYALQGGAAGFVTGVDGDVDTVVGLPIRLVRELLARMETPPAGRSRG
jgi:septum formation protein